MRIALPLLLTALILACGGLPMDSARPIPLTDLPAELSCLTNTVERAPGRLADAHDAAALANRLNKAPKAEVIATACDPATDRFKLGYVVYSLAVLRSREDVGEAAKLLEWNAVQLGNPQAAAKLGSLLVTGGPDGVPPADPVKANGFGNAAADLANQIFEKAGRGRAMDAIAVNTMRMTGLEKHRALLTDNGPQIQEYRASVIDAFERQVGTLD